MSADYRLFVNDERTVLVRVWMEERVGSIDVAGDVEVCLRDDPDAIWGPPIRVGEEPT